MDHELSHRFADLVERHSAGDPDAEQQLRQLRITQTHGQCLFDLYGEWVGAFSYAPGRREVLDPLLSLARWLVEKKRDYVDQKNERAEWRQIVSLRGPVETVGYHECKQCGTETVSMGNSGFYDALDLLCSDCGNVYFKAYYDDTETPACDCGGTYRQTWPCPNCGHEEYDETHSVSPYEYFATHSYTRGTGA